MAGVEDMNYLYKISKLEPDWREYSSGVFYAFEHILLGESFLWDVRFDVRSIEFKAHKLILAIGSPVFEELFYPEEDAEDDGMVIVSDLDPVGFQNMLKYLYTGKLEIKFISEALSTYTAGDKYMIPELKEISERFLTEQDNKPAIVWPVLESAEAMNMEITKQKYLEFIQQNTRDVLRSGGFMSASLRVVRTVLNLDETSAPEIEFLEFLAGWVKKKRKQKPRSLFLALVPHIRFKAIKPKELINFMEKHPDFLEESDVEQIMEHLAKPKSTPLPEWCNPQPPRRNPSAKTFAQKLWLTLKNPQLFD